MKNTYIAIIIIVIVGGVLFWAYNRDANNTTPETVNGAEVNTDQNQTEPGNVAAPAVKEFTVVGKNFSFAPNLITVKKGDRVRILFDNSNGFHDLKIDEYGVATRQAQSPSQEILEFTADRAGSFEYYCSVGTHRAQGMFGILKVEE